MAFTTLTPPSRPSQPNTVRARLDALRLRTAKAQIDPNHESDHAELLSVIRQAMSEHQLSQKAMAINAGCVESELSDALNGRDHRRFDATWLWRQDDAFLLRFLELVMEARNLTPENQSAIRRKRIVELIDLLLTEAA